MAKVATTLAFYNTAVIMVIKSFIVQETVLKTFATVIVALTQQARVFATSIHLHLSLIFAGKIRAYHCGALYRTPL
jgi:hypothetical protein